MLLAREEADAAGAPINDDEIRDIFGNDKDVDDGNEIDNGFHSP
jgi:hypothetical protein